MTATGPWDDTGYRIITTKRYANWRQTLEDLIAEFETAVSDFVAAYADLKIEAKANLGDLYDEDLYPDGDEIRAAFSCQLFTEVIPDRGSTILDLDKARTDKIIADATALDKTRTKMLADHTHKIVRDELEGMIEALGEFGDGIEGSKTARTRTFRDSQGA